MKPRLQTNPVSCSNDSATVESYTTLLQYFLLLRNKS